MLFNSYAFIFLFFPLCLMGFYYFRKKGKAFYAQVFLIFMSIWFYGFLQLPNILVLLISIVVNYGIYHWIKRTTGRDKRLPLTVGIVLNLWALFLFKYTGAAFIPLGISFYTFQQIIFLMECYRGNVGGINFWDYSLYISFFPKLLEGPIMLPREMLGQIYKITRKTVNWTGFFRGLTLFILGLAKKVLLADTLGGAVDYGYSNLAALNSGDALIVILSYTLQIYFDFSGYCEMAMGIAGMLGMELPLNFNAPYKATNIVEFWKRWHITLTRFFTGYLYIPLGGNRKGKRRTYLNMLIIFLASGIWHGAGLQFIIWGLLHGALYVITKCWMEKKKVAASRQKKETAGMGRKLITAGSVAATFLFVTAAWVFFRASTVKEAVTMFQTVFAFDFGKINRDLAGYFNLDEFWYLIKVLGIDGWQYAHYILMVCMLLLTLLLVFFGKTAVAIAGKVKPAVINVIVLAGLLVWCILTFSEVSTFIYFNF